jgi:uncharacterized protein with FMN-binding domain
VSKGIKITIYILGAVSLLFFIMFLVIYYHANKFEKELGALTVDPVEFSKVKDGVYDGVSDLSILTAKVSVKVEKAKVTGIKLLEHKHSPNHGADKITDKIIAAQTLNVDAVTGASLSSKVIKKAVSEALKKGL